ncbi:MAG: serine/threonine-protein kinase [Thermomicrobiales bacterium]
MTDTRAERREPLLIGGRYEVQVEIGSGAFATTWRGMDQRLGRLVAIKILHAQFAHDPAYVQRFEREAQVAAAVSHGNVVDIYDFGRQDDLLYIVMQYIAGEDLKHLIVRERVLPPERAREIVLQILAGVAAIHAAGIVHRDIKPQNVLVGNDGQIRVADFGIAHLDDQAQLTTTGTAFGTAAYMAPEQADGRDIGPATDLYAVGVVFYELLTGTLPFAAPTPMAMMLAHLQETPELPSRRATRWPISRDLDAVTMQALQKRPQDRFRSASAMSQALRNASIHAAPLEAPSASTRATTAATRPVARPVPQPQPQPQPQPRPTAAAARTPDVPSATRADVSRESSGLSMVVRGFVVLLLVAIAVGAFYAWQTLSSDNPESPADRPTPTLTVAATEPTATENVVVPPPSEPTPTETVSAIEPNPTQPPTAEPTATFPPTDEAPTIEPIGPDTGTSANPTANPDNAGGGGGSGSGGGVIEPAPTPTSPG